MEVIKKLKSLLKAHQKELKSLGVRHIYLFGSYANKSFDEQSDIDILIDWEEKKLDVNIYGILWTIQQKLDKQLDVGFLSSLKPEIKKYVDVSKMVKLL